MQVTLNVLSRALNNLQQGSGRLGGAKSVIGVLGALIRMLYYNCARAIGDQRALNKTVDALSRTNACHIRLYVHAFLLGLFAS